MHEEVAVRIIISADYQVVMEREWGRKQVWYGDELFNVQLSEEEKVSHSFMPNLG